MYVLGGLLTSTLVYCFFIDIDIFIGPSGSNQVTLYYVHLTVMYLTLNTNN